MSRDPTPAPPLPPQHVDEDARVCPDCGVPAGSQPFCASCGRNLTTVERLPTRDEWERASAVLGHAEAQMIADQLQGIGTFSPALLSLPVEARRLDNREAEQIVEQAVHREVERSVRLADRSERLGVDIRSQITDAAAMRVTVAVALPDGMLVEQDFDSRLESGKVRPRVGPSGPSRLVTEDRRELGVLSAPSREVRPEPPPTVSTTSGSSW